MRLGRGISGGVERLRDRLVRVRHFRGHGVHSPFVYGLVREVFMQRRLLPGPRALYEALLAAGFPQRRAIEMQNLAIHCGYDTFSLDSAGGALCIVTPRATGRAEALVREAAAGGATAVLFTADVTRAWREQCRRIVAAHPSTSIDRGRSLLLFHNHLPKQHFRI